MTDPVPLRVGLLRLADSAPVLLAASERLFEAQGIAVDVSVEPSWANIADKLAYGVLDAAVMLPPLALAAGLGLRGMTTELLVPMGLTLGGNEIVLNEAASVAIADAADTMTRGRRLVGWMRGQSTPPRFGVVHAYSTHNLLLRYWLAASGGDPDRDMQTVIVPPARVVHALNAGQIDGFCCGAPWGEVAAAEAPGRLRIGGSAIWAGHPEKCLAIGNHWATANPDALTGLLRVMLRTGLLCDQPERAPALAALLADELDLPQAASRAVLPGGGGVELIRFSGAAREPRLHDAMWFLRQMRRWGWLDARLDLAAAAASIYRPDLLLPALAAEALGPLPVPRPSAFCDDADGVETGSAAR